MSYYYADAETVEGFTSPVGDIPPRVRTLEYDANAGRFVLLTHAESWPIPVEWVEKSEAEIEADYPGLLGGA